MPDEWRDPRTGLRVNRPLQRKTPLRSKQTAVRRRPRDNDARGTTPHAAKERSSAARRQGDDPPTSGGQDGRQQPRSRPNPPRKASPPRRTPIKPVSAKRARENRERAATKRRLAADGPIICAKCATRPAVDWHEKLSRARGGSITDRTNATDLCRPCHTWITEHPTEAEQDGWSLPSPPRPRAHRREQAPPQDDNP